MGMRRRIARCGAHCEFSDDSKMSVIWFFVLVLKSHVVFSARIPRAADEKNEAFLRDITINTADNLINSNISTELLPVEVKELTTLLPTSTKKNDVTTTTTTTTTTAKPTTMEKRTTPNTTTTREVKSITTLKTTPTTTSTTTTTTEKSNPDGEEVNTEEENDAKILPVPRKFKLCFERSISRNSTRPQIISRGRWRFPRSLREDIANIAQNVVGAALKNIATQILTRTAIRVTNRLFEGGNLGQQQPQYCLKFTLTDFERKFGGTLEKK